MRYLDEARSKKRSSAEIHRRIRSLSKGLPQECLSPKLAAYVELLRNASLTPRSAELRAAGQVENSLSLIFGDAEADDSGPKLRLRYRISVSVDDHRLRVSGTSWRKALNRLRRYLLLARNGRCRCESCTRRARYAFLVQEMPDHAARYLAIMNRFPAEAWGTAELSSSAGAFLLAAEQAVHQIMQELHPIPSPPKPK